MTMRLRLLILALLILAIRPARALTYADWIASFPSLSIPDRSQLADPDQDSIPNIIEYALAGGDPTQASQSILPKLVFGKRISSALPLFGAQTTAIEILPRFAAEGDYYHCGLRYTPRPNTEHLRTHLGYADSKGNLRRWHHGKSVGSLPIVTGDGSVIYWHLARWRNVRSAGAQPDKMFYHMKFVLP